MKNNIDLKDRTMKKCSMCGEWDMIQITEVDCDDCLNPIRVIRHGLKYVNCYCRCCKFRISQESNTGIMQKVRSHVNSTGHTVDIYRESVTEVTKYKKQLNNN